VVDLDKVLKPFVHMRSIGQFNKGMALRYREMPQDQQEVFFLRYAQFCRDYAFETPVATKLAQRTATTPRRRGQFRQYLTHARRLFHI
jgi:hypothetical protein